MVAQPTTAPIGLANNTPSPNRGGSDEVVGHACSAIGDVASPGLLGLGLMVSALVLTRRRARR
jgi:uncharacterized protein (TIGR03382 family)